MTAVAVIIVTHDSERVLAPCLEALRLQTLLPRQIVLVDSGSGDPGYLEPMLSGGDITLLKCPDNIGFSRANNEGLQHLGGEIEYLLFLNPDVLLAPDSLQIAAQSMRQDERSGMVTGRLRGYDFREGRATGLLDSTGIFRKWYGRWFDRGQGQRDVGQFSQPEYIPAACGALMFCRREALRQAALAGGEVFDPGFFLYKEDIELSLRLRKHGWLIRYEPAVQAWHGRGWIQRREMSDSLRRAAAASELVLYQRHPSPYILWAMLKYVLVRWFGV